MNNIVVPVVNEDFIPFVDELKKRADCKIIVGVKKSLADKIKKTKKQNVQVEVFDDNSKKEEMINSLKGFLDKGKILICRKVLTKEEVDKFLSAKADIVTCKIERNKFRKFFFSVWQVIMQLIFGITFFDGDVSAICFSENLFTVLSNIENLSYSSRINKWKGVQMAEIETSSPPCQKEYSKKIANLKFYGWIGIFVAVVASCFVYFYFFKATFLTGLLYCCAILLAYIGMIIAIAIYILNLKVGDRVFGKAKKAE